MIERVFHGDITEIVDAHASALLLFARQWSNASAEDVVQEAFLQLVRRVKADDPPEIHLGARNASQESVQMLLVNEASLTPVERALFDELEKEISHGR